jgi:hypothetical protein
MGLRSFRGFTLLIIVAMFLGRISRVESAPGDAPAPTPTPVTSTEVASTQKRLGNEFNEIEKLISRLAQAYGKTDPKKAEILKQAFAASKQSGIAPKFSELVALLGNEKYGDATKTQTQLQGDLVKLLELLQSGDQEKVRDDERARIKEWIARIKVVEKQQQGEKARTEGEGDAADISKAQEGLANKTKGLADDVAKSDAKNKSGKNESGEDEKGKNQSGDNDNGDTKSGDSKSGDSKSGDSKSGNNKSGDKEAGDSESGDKKSGNNESGDNKSGDSKSGDNKSGNSKSGDNKSGNKETGKNKSGDSESGDSESGNNKSKDSKSGDSKSGNSKSGNNKSGNKESGKNESGKNKSGDSESGDSKSGDSKSGDSKSGDSKSGNSKSGKNESGNKESGKSESGKSESGDSKSGDSKSGNSKSGDSKSGDMKSGNSESGKSESGDSESGDVENEGGKSGDSRSGDSKSGDSKSGDAIIRRGEGGGELPPKEGKPESSDDSPTKKRLKAAEEKMREAKIKLENAKRKEAIEDQAAALKELKAAREELEQILRQMREEELEQMLAQLEARFRKMLDLQIQVYKVTVGMENQPDEERGRDFEVSAIKLSQREKSIVEECDKAIILLKEEGSAVAFTESAELMREDMLQVVQRLERANTSVITQGLELDVIKALEEMVAALQKAQKEMKNGGGGESPGGGGKPEDQPMVDKIAELKMVRALQERILLRTQRYGKLLGGNEIEQAEKPELIQAIQGLSEREQRLHKVTRDIVLGKNQ